MANHDDRQDPGPELQRLLTDLAGATMPFGKYGPAAHPPQGLALVDLPYEYLAWLARTGFPRGRLGEMLRFVYQAKQDGAEGLFDPIRAARGGPVSLRRARRRHWTFPGPAGAGLEAGA